jgi:2-polyprenyl-6-methoxyphenol hydroxylase-like FAD-dependent oxidoreductase
VGGGVAGLATALGLARSGYEVTVVDRDPLMVADDPDAAFQCRRSGAPQVRHTHGLLARLTATLRDHFPDVLDSLIEAGGIEVDLTLRFGECRPGDESLRVLLARRTTLEWALMRAAVSEPRIDMRGLAAVEGVVASPKRRPIGIRGVRLRGDEVVEADFVVAAGGRRAGVARWLADVGVHLPEFEHETGIVYLTRWYRTERPWERVMGGDDLVKLGGDLGFLFYLAVPADRGSFSLTMAIASDDAELRSRLTSAGAFQRAAEALPLPAGLVASLVPEGPVHPMGGLVNRLCRFIDLSGDPIVDGFHAVGDAHTCTNPIYGRGCSLALVQAVALTDAAVANSGDPLARSRAYEAACRREVEPWYRLSVHADRARRARARSQRDGTGYEPGPMDRILEVGSDDPVLGRAILRVVNLLSTPEDVMSDAEVMGRALELAARFADPASGAADPWARAGPTRAELLAG